MNYRPHPHGTNNSNNDSRQCRGDRSVAPTENAHTSKFKPYPKYKDSGVEWLGEVPEGWEVKPLKRLFSTVNGSTPRSGEAAYWNGDIPWVTPDDLGTLLGWQINETGRSITEDGYKSCGTSVVPANSIILSTRAPIGHLAVAGLPACTNQGCRSLVFKRKSNSKYFYFQLVAARSELESLGQGSTFKELSKNKLEMFPIVEPPQEEQFAITIFLDRKTAEIDALIEKKQKLIELLQEKRTAIISHAVTKGLNPKARMKDSGVEWLGEVPEHWEVKPLKYLCEVRGGVTKGRNFGDVETIELPYLRVANVQDGHLDLTDVATIEIAVSEIERYSLKVGDILMNEGGDNDKLGRGAVWTGKIDPCLHQNHVFAVRPKTIEPEWVALITQSNYAKFYFYQQAKQTTNLASISSSNLKQLPVVVPPKAERLQIMDHVERTASLLDRILEGIKTGAENLKEYRTALISAAVTGKIDVRQVV